MQEDFLKQFGIISVPDSIAKFREGLPSVVVLDDFYENPQGVRNFALQQKYEPDNRYFRGSRTKEKFLFPYLKERLERILTAKITHWVDHQYNGVFQFCPADTEIVFHSDQQSYAAVVYLTPDAPLTAGTAFFKSKETGLRRSPTIGDSQRTGLSLEELKRRTYGGKLLDPAAWETVDMVGNVFNRLVIWDAKLIHAANSYFGSDVTNSRLFHLFFFDCEATIK